MHTVPVEIDPSLHDSPPNTPADYLLRAYLDTAYNLVREAAVRMTILSLREAGFPMPETDEELFVLPGGPSCYTDLAPLGGTSSSALYLSFEILAGEVAGAVEAGLEAGR